MYFLYGSKPRVEKELAATFDSEQQLLAYVRWATLKTNPDGTAKFEQGSALAGYDRWEYGQDPHPLDDPASVPHNPTPSML
jgi:hypothetical protein